MLKAEGSRLVWEYDHEVLWIEPWGANSFRVRAGIGNINDDEDWALYRVPPCKPDITIHEDSAVIKSGHIKAEVMRNGRLTIYNQRNEVMLKETENTYQLKYGGRELKPHPGGSDCRLTLRLESDPDEKLFGMGQYQHSFLNLKGCMLELTHRNSQISVPFLMSNLGYGFLWNNPAIGKASFNLNITEWTAPSAKQLDYWITVGDTPAELEESYAMATGTVPMMPDFGMGFWQCKLRYQTQDELLEVAREYKRRDLPISVIVIDFFHWTNQGDWKFDKQYWPDPEAMVDELREMGIELMVSVWPTVQTESENYAEMLEKGFLVKNDRGVRTQFQFLGQNAIFDATNDAARHYLWNLIKKNYYDYGIKVFWLDEAEPEYTVYDHDIYRYHIGSSQQVGNIYPFKYSQTFFDGMKAEGQSNIINLVRCAWAGSQRYGALVWSGDIHSSFDVLAVQVRAGLNMAIAGIPWWTTDIGGFHGGNPDDPSFRECFIRWFQYGAFCPVFRLHGDRQPARKPIGATGGGQCASGADNEVWSYGDEAYEIAKKYLHMRERLKPYIRRLMKEAHERGTPPMRPMFYDFHQDPIAWEVEDQFMFGPDILVAPVLQEGARNRSVYLPSGIRWIDPCTNRVFDGGQLVIADAPLESIPLFLREGADIPIKPDSYPGN